LLHATLKAQIHTDEWSAALAAHQKDGFLNISDHRVFTPWGRVSDPEDLIGAVLLENGKIVPNSFEPTYTHRIVSTNGLFQLSEELHEKLVERLRKL
ncbi:hypothetical protein HDU98_005814, partial [Podochytrium sp. JEL0797]